ncbi:DUF4429 domain-containing protein [Streptosporangium sp. NPDC023615]|uniref:DUF4429 domain-containing protein n=1 Tax=Streptosporangium sp. NPDC023615 TaxID=3154794 RepID=UPI003418D46A
MAEIFVPNGSWTFDGETLRIVPGGSDAHELRRTLGELTIPLAAVAGVSFEPSRKGGDLQLRLRPGADPLSDVVAGRFSGAIDPYRLAVPKDRVWAAEYLVDEVRSALALEGVPGGPCERFLLPGPAVPVSASAGDGTVSFDGERIRLDWTLFATSGKQSAGSQTFLLGDLEGVEWAPQSGAGYGHLRFRLRQAGAARSPEDDVHCLSWGLQRYGGVTALVAAAVLARLPRHVEGRSALAAAPDDRRSPDDRRLPDAPEGHRVPARGTTGLDEHDAVMRRLGELGELYRSGVLTDEEFASAKRSLLRRLEET